MSPGAGGRVRRTARLAAPRTPFLPGLLVGLLIVALGGCAALEGSSGDQRPPPRVTVSDGWLAMGTFFEAELRARPDEVARARGFLEWARVEIARLERIYSRHDPESEVSALNRALARPDALARDQTIAPELESLLFSSIEVWEASGGAFDITVGPLIELWQRAADAAAWPAVAELRLAKRRVGSGHLLLPGDGVLGVTTQGLQIDLDGISKGAVLDRLAERLAAELPHAPALLSFGQSSVLAVGDPDDGARGPEGGWRLEIRSRGPRAQRLAVVRLRDRALSVSSSVGSVREIAGQEVSHVVDPRTGSAVEGSVEAAVVARRAAIADGFSTALLVLGAERSTLRRIERAGLDAIVIERGGRALFSEGWDALASPDRP